MRLPSCKSDSASLAVVLGTCVPVFFLHVLAWGDGGVVCGVVLPLEGAISLFVLIAFRQFLCPYRWCSAGMPSSHVPVGMISGCVLSPDEGFSLFRLVPRTACISPIRFKRSTCLRPLLSLMRGDVVVFHRVPLWVLSPCCARAHHNMAHCLCN